MAMRTDLKSGLRMLKTSEAALFKLGSSGFHSTGMKSMSGGHSHEPFYVHAKHMYNLDRMKYQKVKMPLAVFSAFSLGVAVPIIAVIFQQKKTASA